MSNPMLTPFLCVSGWKKFTSIQSLRLADDLNHYYARLYEHTHRFSTTPNCLISLISFFNCLLFINSYHCKMDLNINGTLNFNTIKLLGSFITLRHALHRKLHRKRRLLNLSSWENIACLQILVPSQISFFLFLSSRVLFM